MKTMGSKSKAASEGVGSATPVLSGEKAIVGLLALALADREERLRSRENAKAESKTTLRRSETVLSDAGLTLPEIARLVGRDYEVVKGVVRRDREAREARKRAAQPTSGTDSQGEADGNTE